MGFTLSQTLEQVNLLVAHFLLMHLDSGQVSTNQACTIAPAASIQSHIYQLQHFSQI